MDLAVAAGVFPLVFLAELPDKTMFASLVLGTRGRPLAVWIGVALAFAVHVTLAVVVGASIGRALPRQWLDAFVAGVFAAGAVYAFVAGLRGEDEQARVAQAPSSAARAVAVAFGVIFVAEWGDLTQIVVFNLATRYHDAASVGLGSWLAMCAVAALAVGAGQGLLRLLSVRRARQLTAVVLAALAVVLAVQAGLG